ncbi:MAG: hypothetical protein GXY83_04720 [Rhodopirellula sp.]|nr:hypothetical protein [Rhodopirellula sp.]
MEKLDLPPQIVILGRKSLYALGDHLELHKGGVYISFQFGNAVTCANPSERCVFLPILLHVPILKLNTFVIRQRLAARRSVMQLLGAARTHCRALFHQKTEIMAIEVSAISPYMYIGRSSTKSQGRRGAKAL